MQLQLYCNSKREEEGKRMGRGEGRVKSSSIPGLLTRLNVVFETLGIGCFLFDDDLVLMLNNVWLLQRGFFSEFLALSCAPTLSSSGEGIRTIRKEVMILFDCVKSGDDSMASIVKLRTRHFSKVP